MAFTQLNSGSFVSTGAAVNIPVPSGCDYFVAFNQTQAATTQSTGRGIKFEWDGNPSMAVDSAYETKKTNSTDALNMVLVTSGGFTYLQAYPAPQAAVTGTDITAATPAVVTMTNTYTSGDRVVLYATTGMAQIGGMTFTISSATGGGFTLKGLAASGFAAAATAVTSRRVYPFNEVLPEFMYVTAISKASSAVVTVSTDPTNTVYVGQKLVFQVPSSFGMTEVNSQNLNGIPAIVTAVDYANYKFTIDVNSTAFTTFAFPASTASPTAPLFATVSPDGSQTSYDPIAQTYTGYNFDKQPYRSSQSFPLMNLQGGAQSPAGSDGDIINWKCFKGDTTSYGSGS